MIHILICDDDKAAAKRIETLIHTWSEKHNHPFTTDMQLNSSAVIKQKAAYDIAFIDVEMPGTGGLRLAEEIKKVNPDAIVIISTSFESYIDDAMKIKVFRYIRKPVDPNRFDRIMFDAVTEYTNICRNIIIECGEQVHYVRTKDILFIENIRGGSRIATTQGDYKTGKKPEHWQKIINQPACFVYSHKSYVINLQNVISFNRTTVLLKLNESESIQAYMSQRKYTAFKKSFLAFAGGIR